MTLPFGPLDAVLLDAGGVLLLPDPDAIREALAPFGVPCPDDDTCHRNHYRLMREVDARMHGIDGFDEPDWSGLDRTMVGYFGVAKGDEEAARLKLRDAYLEMPWVAAPGAVEALLALEGAGVPLAVVSNASGDMEEQLLNREICSVDSAHVKVAIVVDSQVVGVSKPDPRIFQFALDALGVPAERCLYVGDTVHFDVKGARNAGLHPVHVNPQGLCPHDDHPHVGALADVPGLLGLSNGRRPG
ncbi:MAG: HAD family hydrolase [Acidimicrobiales bacterium]